MDDSPQQRTWIALLGRQDKPTDGVEDYCTFLRRHLAQQRINLEHVRTYTDNCGAVVALWRLRRECRGWRNNWVLLQYTALGWSRRGFPLAAAVAVRILRRAGARVAIVFHEYNRQGGLRLVNRVRGACQDWVIHQLYRHAEKAVFTVPLDAVTWLAKEEDKAVFIPIGANIPENTSRRTLSGSTSIVKTVLVFGVTGPPRATIELEEISGVLREASKAIPKLRLVVFGRGALEARGQLAKALHGSGVELIVRGVLPAEKLVREFECADVQLFVRSALTVARGSALAGIACGLPVVAYRNGSLTGPLREAGIEWSAWKDRDALTRGLVRVLSDPSCWAELHRRNVEMQKTHFSWHRIAERFRMELNV